MENLTTRQKYIIAGIIVLLIIMGFVFLQVKQRNNIVIEQGNEAVTSQKPEGVQPQPIAEPKPEEPKLMVVHVSGQVINPGIVELTEGSRINDAVKKAGGATRSADFDQVNLAAKLCDGEKVYIPKKGEKAENVMEQTKSGQSTVNINTANKDELDDIPGVGPLTAEKIIEYRRTKGAFKKIEDIKNVSGIGDKKFESIKAYITI